MSVQDLEARLGRAPDVFVHIGAGDGSDVELAKRAARAVLVEPDPIRFKMLELACGGTKTISARQVALGSISGPATFFSQSLRRFGSTRRVTGARQLYRGLQSAGEYEVHTETLGALLGEVNPDQGLAVIIDAPSEALVALEQIREAGWLERRVAIQIKLADFPLHEGGADRAGVEDWIKTHGYASTPVAGRSGLDIGSVWLDLPQAGSVSATGNISADDVKRASKEASSVSSEASSTTMREMLKRMESRYAALEERNKAQGKLVQKHRSKANRLTKQLEETEASRQKLEETVIRLEAKLEEEASAAFREKFDVERTAREEAETRVKALEAEIKQAREAYDATRDDLALTLRTQNMAQSDLQELQERYEALAEEKRSLEELLSKLMERLYDASERVEALSWARAEAENSEGPTERAKEG